MNKEHMDKARAAKIDSKQKLLNKKTQIETLKQKGIVTPKWYSNSQVSVYFKAHTTNSKASAIKSKCHDCCCGYNLEIANCEIVTCPLHSHRPYKGVKNDKA